jgi:hypothetical protein
MAVEDYAQGFWDVIDRVDVAHLAGFDQQGERRSFFRCGDLVPNEGCVFLGQGHGAYLVFERVGDEFEPPVWG